MLKYEQYESPICQNIGIDSFGVFCGSSQPGGNESIIIEDWDY